MKNKDECKHIADEAGSDYMKGNSDNDLKLIKDFITKINNGKINESNAASEFKKLKQKVNNDKLKHDLVKYLENSLFGENLETTDNFLEHMEEQEKGQKRFSDDYDSNGWSIGSGLKILTNKQMLKRLPILLAQIQAGNNSNKLKNEARQILYLLYRSKSLTKTVYNNLIESIGSK